MPGGDRLSGGSAGRAARSLEPPAADAAVYVISVAAELTGLHPQTLRTYERLGLITPGRTRGGGRRYSRRDVELLREIAELTSSGIGIEGVRRIMDLEHTVAALRARNVELTTDLVLAREQAARAERGPAIGAQLPAASNRLPVLHQPTVSRALVVWRRGQGYR